MWVYLPSFDCLFDISSLVPKGTKNSTRLQNKILIFPILFLFQYHLGIILNPFSPILIQSVINALILPPEYCLNPRTFPHQHPGPDYRHSLLEILVAPCSLHPLRVVTKLHHPSIVNFSVYKYDWVTFLL